ncbi:MAG: AAA family ATPase [Nitrospirae bacterium]|nr:AAA family ATPase [Nitrospirota bacterium]
MLQRIALIKNVGRFATCKPSDATLKKFTLIYGENGLGKSTLCAIIRSLSSGSISPIASRTRLGEHPDKTQKIEILLKGSSIEFEQNAWSTGYTGIEIFDHDFIHGNVYAADSITSDHRQNLCTFALGEEGVTLSKKIADLLLVRSDNNTEVKNTEENLKALTPDTQDLRKLRSALEVPNTALLITELEQELKNANNSETIKGGKNLLDFQIPEIPGLFFSILDTTLPDIQESVSRAVADHISDHNMGIHGERWLADGLSFIEGSSGAKTAGKTCPFCQQPLDAAGIVRLYEEFFSSAYKNHVASIKDAATKIHDVFSDMATRAITSAFLTNTEASCFWEKNELNVPQFQATTEKTFLSALDKTKQACLDLLQKKLQAPLSRIPISQDLTTTQSELRNARTTADKLNKLVQHWNQEIEKLKKSVQQADKEQITSSLRSARTSHERHCVPEIKSACDKLDRLKGKKGEINIELEGAREKLEKYSADQLDKYQEKINEYLRKFSATFNLGSFAPPDHRGKRQSIKYPVIVNNTEVDIHSAGAENEPSFKTVLSEGDKRSLALSLFLARIEADSDLETKTLVFDDPFTSLDGNRTIATINAMVHIGLRCKQMIVLSHDDEFLGDLTQRLRESGIYDTNIQCLEVRRDGDTKSTISTWNVDVALEDKFFTRLNRLKEFVATGNGDREAIRGSIRKVLERYCRVSTEGEFRKKDALGSMIREIKKTPSHRLSPLLQELTEINSYVTTTHHDQGSSRDKENTTQSTELTSYAKRTLTLVSSLSYKHDDRDSPTNWRIV